MSNKGWKKRDERDILSNSNKKNVRVSKSNIKGLF